MFSNFDDFEKVFAKCTANHCCLVMDNTTGSANIEDTIFWYKAKLSNNLPTFKLGKPIYWNLSRNYEKSESDIQNDAKLLAEEELERQKHKKERITAVRKCDEDFVRL